LEFKLNKIDTDIRKKMQEEIKEDKVHSGKGINVTKDLKDEKNEYINLDETKEENEKRYITIDGIRDNRKNISVKAEKVEEINYENSKGRILDKKK
jgi:hypothetical protein